MTSLLHRWSWWQCVSRNLAPVRFIRCTKTILHLLLLLIIPLLSGCLVIPIPANRHDPEVRRNVRPELVTAFATNKFTRAEVLLRLGEPDEVSPEETDLHYRTSRVKCDIIWIVAGYGTAVGGDIEIHRYYDFLMRFDNEGNLIETSWLAGSNRRHLHQKATSNPGM